MTKMEWISNCREGMRIKSKICCDESIRKAFAHSRAWSADHHGHGQSGCEFGDDHLDFIVMIEYGKTQKV